MVEKRYRRLALIAIIASGVFGPGNVVASDETNIIRWFTEQQVEHGRTLYLMHCIACHGQRGKATVEWRKVDAAGNYPPPPLNGSAHTWHHPLSVLERSIAAGGIPNGGVMPGFAETLDKQEIRATIAYIQSLWSDDIYARWLEIDNRE